MKKGSFTLSDLSTGVEYGTTVGTIELERIYDKYTRNIAITDIVINGFLNDLIKYKTDNYIALIKLIGAWARIYDIPSEDRIFNKKVNTSWFTKNMKIYS